MRDTLFQILFSYVTWLVIRVLSKNHENMRTILKKILSGRADGEIAEATGLSAEEIEKRSILPCFIAAFL